MGKIKEKFQNKSLKTAFSQYMAGCILTALVLSLILSNLCLIGQTKISAKYQHQYSHEINVGDNGSYNVQVRTEDISEFLTPTESIVYKILGVLSVGIYPVCFISFIILTSVLFYKRQLHEPLMILNHAADNIAESNLDFSIAYDKDNELGKLCTSFEKMRVALQENNAEMWRQVEERKRLNAAFSHDLRTPLTVLKGQSEMLSQYAPKMSEEKIIATAEMMKRHIIRLENYVNTMNALQRLEDIEVKKEFMAVIDLEKQMNMTGVAVCREKEYVLSCNISDTDRIKIDPAIVMQVYENLLSNAFRYAKSKIEIIIEKRDDIFLMTVKDDGAGFTAKDLSDAWKPFYKAENETDNEHFGMGLNICKILCEKHGGYLQMENENGAKMIAAFRI